VYPCGRAADTKRFRLFNLMDERLDLDASRRALRDLHHKDAWYVRCFVCPARRICSFGCPAFEAGNPAEREIQCDFTRELYQFFVQSPELLSRVRQVLEETFSGASDEPPGIALAARRGRDRPARAEH
jgi:radical SAM protein with 4Fe4S-binding SPASM domain